MDPTDDRLSRDMEGSFATDRLVDSAVTIGLDGFPVLASPVLVRCRAASSLNDLRRRTRCRTSIKYSNRNSSSIGFFDLTTNDSMYFRPSLAIRLKSGRIPNWSSSTWRTMRCRPTRVSSEAFISARAMVMINSKRKTRTFISPTCHLI